MQLVNTTTQSKSVKSVRDMRWHVGSLIRILDTDAFQDEMTGIETIVRRGLEPPEHTHSHEDEAVYVLRGDVEFRIGDEVLNPMVGEWVYMPRHVAHSYRILSDDAHMLVMYTPGGISGFYEVLSEPAEEASIPAGSLSYDNLFDMEYIAELGRQFGLKFKSRRVAARAAAA